VVYSHSESTAEIYIFSSLCQNYPDSSFFGKFTRRFLMQEVCITVTDRLTIDKQTDMLTGRHSQGNKETGRQIFMGLNRSLNSRKNVLESR
jgi:hypothetical protein